MLQYPYAVETSRGAVTFRTVGAPIVGITQEDVDAAEWLALESAHIRCPMSGYLLPKPSRVSRGIMYWTGTGCGKGKAHPNAYKAPKSLGVAVRAKSVAQAELLLSQANFWAGTSTRYTAPQLGPVEYGVGSVVLKYNAKKATWTIGGR
jgi:hypothetical protein